MLNKTERALLALALLTVGVIEMLIPFPILAIFLSAITITVPLWFLKFIRTVYHEKTQRLYDEKVAKKKAMDEAKRLAIEKQALARLSPKAVKRGYTPKSTYRNAGPR